MKYALSLLLILIVFFTATNYATSQNITFRYSYGTYNGPHSNLFYHNGLSAFNRLNHPYYMYSPGNGLYYHPYQPYQYYPYYYQPSPQIYTVPHIFPFQ